MSLSSSTHSTVPTRPQRGELAFPLVLFTLQDDFCLFQADKGTVFDCPHHPFALNEREEFADFSAD